MHRFDPTVLHAQLSELPQVAQAAFALACAERLAATAASLPEQTEAVLRHARLYVGGDHLEDPVVAGTLAKLEAEADIDDDVNAAAFYVLECCRRSNAQAAVWAAQRAYDHSDAIAQEAVANTAFDADTEQRLRSHPGVQAELACQAADLRDLCQSGGLALQVATRARSGGSAA